MPIAAGTASVLLQKVSPSITPRPLDSPMEGTYSSSTPPPAAVRSTAATAGGEASSTTASLDDVISLAARTLNPDHLRNASNEELLRIMQTLKKQQQPQASTSSQEPVKGNSSPMNEDSRVASDDVAAPVNGIAAAAAESDSQPMSGVQSFSPNKNDMRRQSVSLPVFSDKGSSSQMYNIDRRGSLGSLPRMLGMTDRDEDSRRASYGQIPLPSDGEGFSKDGDNENSFRIPLARSASPQQSSSALTTASSPQAFDQRLRLEVEATLHKTLELEYMLTMKEFKSYEAQGATADIEYNRALLAFRENETAMRESRRVLENAIQERSEVQSIIRYLTSRLDGLTSRIRDGSNRLTNLKAAGSEAKAGSPSLISGRRHSSPGLMTLTGQGPFSINNDIDEWTRNELRKDDERMMIKADPDAPQTPSGNQKRARTTSPADGESELAMALADNRKAALSVNTNMGHYGGGPTSALSNAEAPSLNSLSATDTDSHTHAIVLAGGQSHHHAGHSQNSGLAPNACVAYQRIQCPLSTKDCTNHHVCIRCNGPHPVIMCKKDRNVCVKWNMEECTSACHREHRCLRCASKEHTLRVCPIRPLGGAEFCFAWNSAGTCRIMDCRRLHECIRCGTSHPSIICPENLDNYLIEYIKRRRGEGVPEDDLQRLEAQINSSLPQNGPSSHPNQASMSVSLAGLAPSNNQLPQLHNQYSSSSLNQTHPMHIAAVAAASASMRPMQQQQQHQQQQQQQQQYGGQGNIGIGSVGASGQYAALLQQQQQYSNQGNMNVHAPHQSPNMMAGNLMMSPMDERQTKRLRGDDQHSMYGVGLSGGNTMMQMGGQMVNQMTQGYGRQQNMPGVQNMYQQQQFGYNPQLIGGLVGQTAGTGGGSFLAEGDRKTICRDYNNFKCESEDGRCRFRHVCLRCGAHDHRERNCGLFESPH